MLKAVVCFVGLAAVVPALHAQAAYSASRLASLQVGVEGSAFTLDNNTGHEEGIGVYGDLDVGRHLGLEGVYRNASLQTPHDIGENHLLAGPRYRFHHGPFEPYAKGLVGLGTITFQQGFNATSYSEHYFIYAVGGGVDFHASRHINVRLFDFEYQFWPGFAPNGLTPYGYSAGVAYHF